jgi:hypothetical protein
MRLRNRVDTQPSAHGFTGLVRNGPAPFIAFVKCRAVHGLTDFGARAENARPGCRAGPSSAGRVSRYVPISNCLGEVVHQAIAGVPATPRRGPVSPKLGAGARGEESS